MFEVRQLEPPKSAGNTFSIFFQPPLCPVLDWSQTYRSQNWHAFLSFLKYVGLILVKMPLGCRNSKLKATTAASSEEAVLNRISCGCCSGKSLHRGEGCVLLSPLSSLAVTYSPCHPACSVLLSAHWPAAGWMGQGLCYRKDLLYQTRFIFHLHSHNRFCIAVRLRGLCAVTAVTQAMSCFFYPDMCFILLISPPLVYVQHGCGWTSPQPNPLRFSFGEENLACFSPSLPPLPCPSVLAPPFFSFFLS